MQFGSPSCSTAHLDSNYRFADNTKPARAQALVAADQIDQRYVQRFDVHLPTQAQGHRPVANR
jgi:hypothetical protein